MKTTGAPTSRKARALYARSYQGILSTLSIEIAGHPFGSVVSFAPDRNGWPVILISRIAEHTRNIDADPRVSLIVTEGGDDAQENGRLTIVGKAVPVAAGDAKERYFRRFPHAEAYQRVHDFAFYTLEPIRIRYIGGFSQIHWLALTELCLSNPFPDTAERGMAAHMNKDHADAMRAYCRLYGVKTSGQIPRLTGIDAEGFDLMLGKRLVRIDFDAPVNSAEEVRKAMISLASQARELASAIT